MRMTRLSLIIVTAGFLLQTSCLMLDIPWNMGGGYSGEFHRILDLEPGGTVQLDNLRGDAEIRGWDENRLEVTARQEGSQAYGGGEFSLWSVRPEPRVTVDKAGNSVTIKTLAAQREELQPIVHYLIYVPRSVNLSSIHVGRGSLIIGDVYGQLTASLGDGDLTIDNYSGSIKVALVKGTIEAEVLDLRAGDRIEMGVDQGDISLTLEQDAGARFEGDAGKGRITSDFDLGAPVSEAMASGTIGDGRALIKLKTSDGNIRLKEAQ